MRLHFLLFIVAVTGLLTACDNKKNPQAVAPFLSAKEAIRLNQVVYKSDIQAALDKYAPGFEAVYIPAPVNGNHAVIIKERTANRYALVIRGSVMEFSNEGFQNFILQDFNIFRIKEWPYTDTVKEAYISNGAWIGFQNLLLLKDKQTGLSVKDFIEQKIPAHSSIVVTGHSLGGNLAYPFAGYLENELSRKNKIALQLITFGAPAVGNAAFVKDMEAKFPDAERYAASRDIASLFPDTENIANLARAIGLDSVLQMDKLNIFGVDADNLLSIANVVLEKTNVINETNKYVQSQKHLRLMTVKDNTTPGVELSADAIFNRAYQFHQVDMYAELLGVGKLE
jgi:hypothetical protein